MSMDVVNTQGLPGGSGGVAETIGGAIGELQRLKVAFVHGANTNVNIPVTGIATEDTLVNVVEYASRQVKEAVVTGATATTDIAVTGIAVGDILVSVVDFAAGVPTDLTSEASISGAGTIQLSTTDTHSDKLIVTYYHVATDEETNLTSVTTIASAGNLHVNADTRNAILGVIYFDKTA